jgi:hypothetical protein
MGSFRLQDHPSPDAVLNNIMITIIKTIHFCVHAGNIPYALSDILYDSTTVVKIRIIHFTG